MPKTKRGMDAVIEKTSAAGKRRKPALKRKGPGIAIMIAVGKPKPGMGEGKGEMPGEMKGKGEPGNPKERLAILEARIKELEAKLAMMGGDEEEGEEMDDEDEDEDAY